MTDVRVGRVTRPRRPGRAKKQEQEPASEEITEVAPGVLRMQLPIWMPGLGHVNMYGLLDDRGLAVVDPGLPGPKSWKALKQRLKTAGLHASRTSTPSSSRTRTPTTSAARAASRRRRTPSSSRTRRSPRGRSTERAGATTLSEPRRSGSSRARSTAAAAQALDIGGEEIPTLDDHDDDYEGDPLRDDPTDRDPAPVGAVGRRDAVGRQQAPDAAADAPDDDPRDALAVRAAGPDAGGCVHGERVQLAGRDWLAIHTPGHTLDHLCLYDPEHGVLLSGDHVLPSITPHISGVGQGADALHSYLATLDLVAALDGVKLGLPAHGHPFDDVPGRVDAIKEHHDERMEKLARGVARDRARDACSELSHEIFPERHWGVMAESETFAHLEHLVLAGEAERWDEPDRRLVYRVA